MPSFSRRLHDTLERINWRKGKGDYLGHTTMFSKWRRKFDRGPAQTLTYRLKGKLGHEHVLACGTSAKLETHDEYAERTVGGSHAN